MTEAASGIVLETDRDLDLHEGFERLFGCRKHEVVVERSFWADPDERARYIEMVRRVGSVREMPAKGRRMDGTPLCGLASATTIDIAGRACLLTFARSKCTCATHKDSRPAPILIASPETRVVLMSGYSPTWNAETLKQIGARDLLPKPNALLALSTTVRKGLGPSP